MTRTIVNVKWGGLSKDDKAELRAIVPKLKMKALLAGYESIEGFLDYELNPEEMIDLLCSLGVSFAEKEKELILDSEEWYENSESIVNYIGKVECNSMIPINGSDVQNEVDAMTPKQVSEALSGFQRLKDEGFLSEVFEKYFSMNPKGAKELLCLFIAKTIEN